MKLFRITKKMPNDWFNRTHKAVTEITDITEVRLMKEALLSQYNDFYVSNKDKAATLLLVAYCNLREHHMTNAERRRVNKAHHFLQINNHLN